MLGIRQDRVNSAIRTKRTFIGRPFIDLGWRKNPEAVKTSDSYTFQYSLLVVPSRATVFVRGFVRLRNHGVCVCVTHAAPFVRSSHVSGFSPVSTSTIVMHSSTGQTSEHKLQPTHSVSSTRGILSSGVE